MMQCGSMHVLMAASCQCSWASQMCLPVEMAMHAHLAREY